MKNMMKLFGIIALAAVIGFTMAACDNGDDDDSSSPLDGTWVDEVKEGTKLVIGSGKITVSNYDDSRPSPYYEIMKGNISTSGSKLTVRFTQVNSAMLGQDGVSMGLVSNKFYTKEEMKILIIAGLTSKEGSKSAAEAKYDTDYKTKVDEQFGEQTGTWTIDDNTLTLNLDSQGIQVYKKNGTYTAPPWRWSVYKNEGGTSAISMTESSGTLTFAATISNNGYVGINVRPNATMLASLKTAASIKFDFYGDGNTYVISVATSDITNYQYYRKEITPTANTWESVTISIDELEQPTWSDNGVEKDFTQSLAQEIQIQADWQVTSFTFKIRDLVLQ